MTTNTEHERIDAGKLRDLIKTWRQSIEMFPDWGPEIGPKILNNLEKLLPAPQPRTLKDMTHEEREACRWAQADYDDGYTEHPVRVIITVTYPNVVDILLPNGVRNCVRNSEITPRLDLPRMAWPDEHPTAHDDEGMAPEVEEGVYGQALWDMITKAIRDEKEYHIDAQDYEGVKRWRDAERALRTAMETNPPKESPVPTRPEHVPVEEPWIVEFHGERYVGARDQYEAPHWALAQMDGTDIYFADDELVTLVTRLVPEGKA